MLKRARELADLLLPAFGTKFGMPPPHYALGSNINKGRISTIIGAEPGSLTMELTRLSQLTGDLEYYKVALRITELFASFESPYGSLISTSMGDSGEFRGQYSIGGMIDSYYEYLIKMCQLLGNPKGIHAKLYQKTVEVSISERCGRPHTDACLGQDMYQYLFVNVTV
jgi:mannosyl-oligosaccharide alpha-1,2-mannosidase